MSTNGLDKFWWEKDHEDEGEGEGYTPTGEWGVVQDDRTGVVLESGPEGWEEERPYSPAEENRRAAQLMAVQLEADLTRELDEHDERLTEAREKVSEVEQGLTDAKQNAQAALTEAAAAKENAKTAIDDAFDATTTADSAAKAAAEAKQKADQAEAKALGAQADADALDGKMSTLDGKITVSTRNPTTSDATDKPDQAIWEVRSGTTVLRRFILTGRSWTQVKVGTDFIGENSIGAAQIADATIGTAQIADAAVTNAKIGSLSVSKLTADAVRMDKAAIEQLIGDAAYFNTLTADKLVIHPGNLWPDPTFKDAASWSGTGVEIVDDPKMPGGRAFQLTRGTSQQGAYYGGAKRTIVKLDPGCEYVVRLAIKAENVGDGSNIAVFLRGRTSSGGLQIAHSRIVLDASASGYTEIETVIGTKDWTEPVMGTVGLHDTAPYTAGTVITVGGAEMVKRVGGTLIEDGAITTNKLMVTDDMWAKMLTVAGDATIGGNLIVPGTIDAGKVRMDAAYAREMAAMMARFQAAFIGKLTAQMIEADSFSGFEVRGAKIVSPGKAGDITISDNAITSSRFDESGEPSETMVIGGADGDSISLTPAPSEPPTVVISGAGGDASFAGAVEAADVSVGGNSLMEWMNRAPRGLIGWTWGSGASLPNVGQGAYGLVRFVWPLEKGRRYRVAGNVLFSGQPGDVIEFNFYYRAADELVNLSSPQVGMHRFQIPAGGVGAAHIEHIYSETYSHDNYSSLISVRNLSSASRSVSLWNDGGSDRSQSQFYVEDLGLAVGSAGIEWDAAGGRTFVPPQSSTPPPPPPPPPPVKRTYIRTYRATNVYSWRGGAEVSDVLHHGTHQGIRRVSQIVFPYQVQQDLTGATIKKVEVRLRNLHTHQGSGMTASLVPATNSGKSSTPTGASKSNETRVQWSKGQTKFVTINNWKANARSVYLGHYADSSGAFYGKFSRKLEDCVLKVTYEK